MARILLFCALLKFRIASQAPCPAPEFISADDPVRLHSSDYLITISYMPKLRDLVNEMRATVTGRKNSDYFILQQSLDELHKAIYDGLKTHPDISVLSRESLGNSAKMLYNESRDMIWGDTTSSMRISVAGLEKLLADIPDKDLSSDGWTVPYIEGREETEMTNLEARVDNLPATTNVQNTLLGGSNTSNLSPSSLDTARLKPTKRKSDGDLSKRRKAAKLTPQNLCGETKLDSGEDVAASFSSAIPAMKLDPENQHNEASTSKIEKGDREMKIEVQKATSNVHTGETTDFETQNNAIKDGDTISIDSEDAGGDGSTVAELLRQLKVRPNIRLTKDVAMGNENTEQLALKEVMNAVPAWKDCLIVKNREASKYFDRASLNSFHKLHQLTGGLIHKKGMPDCMRTELKMLLNKCEDASSIYLSRGKYDRDGINDQITTIEAIARSLCRDREMDTSAKSKTDFAGPKADGSPPPKDDCGLQPVSTSGERSGRPRIPIQTGDLTALTGIPSGIYSQKSRTILHNLWGGAGMKVKDALKYVHGKMLPEQHELLCRGAWNFQVGKMRPLSHQWVDFCRFAFKQKLGNEERRVFAELAKSIGEKTAEGITTDWQCMFIAIGESLKHQLQKTDYDLCPCHISQPHSMTALTKSLQFLHDAEKDDAEKDDAEKNDAEDRIKQAVSACTALIFLELIIEEGDKSPEHTYKDSHEAIRTAIQGFENAEGLSDEAKYDLSNIIVYLDAAKPKSVLACSKSER
ncbi:hypothetical protein V493_02934 [Pseudogymnoascus sp. VKM F-4281 (FW-2241)]|nr:hypothetical protein V493_02934 [Pseudogymnoascus sp. VKM F-4281 (FW-2241)]